MKHALLTASLLLAALSVLPAASADAAPTLPVQCYGPLDGYQSCEVQQGACRAGETLEQGDLHVHAECQPTDGKSRCGVDAYAAPLVVTRHCRGNEEQVWPTKDIVSTASVAGPVQCHGPLDGQQSCEVQQGACHAGEAYDAGDVHVHAECQPTDGKSRCGVDAYAAPLVVTRHCRGNEEQVWPTKDIVDAPQAAASVGVRECQTYPGYTDCVHTVGPCSVTTRWYHHDAFYVVYGPHCEKPAA